MITWSHVKHFSLYEFQRPECLRLEMIQKLDELREACGFPLVVTSSWRDREHNAAVGGVNDSSHCLAEDGLYSGVDIATHNIGGGGLYKLVRNALTIGYNRIGIYPRHVHLDVENRLPQQIIWVGKD